MKASKELMEMTDNEMSQVDLALKRWAKAYNEAFERPAKEEAKRRQATWDLFTRGGVHTGYLVVRIGSSPPNHYQ
jgi:hypothetical protein